MRLKTDLKPNKHTGLVSCVGWLGSEDVYTCGDDHSVLRWNSFSCSNMCTLPEEVYATDMHWYPKTQSSGKRQNLDLLLITSADGKFHLVNKSGRIEKSVEAHQGAALVGQWSYDGAGLLTAGEDGQVKIWSRSGMLRSTVLQGDVPVFTATWGADSNHVLLAQGRSLVVKPLAPNTKPIRWRAHDGLILKVSWNQSSHLIVSGGEDCKYKVWDSHGTQMYSSSPGEHPVTCLSWSPGGDLFAVGAFNTLRLCDRSGWSYCLEKPPTGSFLGLAWSGDGTQLVGACGNGTVVFAHIVDRRIEWKNLIVTQKSRKSITVKDVLTEVEDKLDFSERVAKMALDHGRMVVVTNSQCHIFSTNNWNTPIVVELKDGCASLILMSYRHFLLAERWGINIYSYDGKLLFSPKIPGMSFESLDPAAISLSADTLTIVDQNDDKVIQVLDLGGGRQATNLPSISHTLGVMRVGLAQAGSAEERDLAFLDRNRDLYLCKVRSQDGRRSGPRKLAVMVHDVAWNSETNILAGLQDSVLTVWFYPTALYIDKKLLRKTNMAKELSEYGRSPQIVSFVGNHLQMRRIDGSMTGCALPGYYTVLHGFVGATKWDDALRLCRNVKVDVLWACLACMACHGRNLSTAEEAFAAIDELDKVSYLEYVRTLTARGAQAAHLALLAGDHKAAESLLLANGLIFRAIMVHLETHQWNRALELAVKHRTHVDTVLYKRRCFLEAFDKTETNEKFIQYQNQVELDPQRINEKIQVELSKERDKKS